LISFVTPASKERLKSPLPSKKKSAASAHAISIDPTFLQNVDAAIVVDRRGTRDIVTSYAGIVPFCGNDYGRIFETAGALAGMPDWKMAPGGLSDAKFFAEFGIPSVNLSVGYEHEHTEFETLDYKAALETVLLLEAVLETT
jgi:tripeptide aminopeptidase